ncbi:hypothetical protein JTE90_007645 [Oedothorax gibbosus]|uniref:Uncharacterized protein n=1 Tax=Oedothorax gibbosus TaxID=931172 RepID=A0AAV6UKP0_9ARAC|nr:hypothetical protein JTE90_007645 [Oedothorax gibbosus]
MEKKPPDGLPTVSSACNDIHEKGTGERGRGIVISRQPSCPVDPSRLVEDDLHEKEEGDGVKVVVKNEIKVSPAAVNVYVLYLHVCKRWWAFLKK